MLQRPAEIPFGEDTGRFESGRQILRLVSCSGLIPHGYDYSEADMYHSCEESSLLDRQAGTLLGAE